MNRRESPNNVSTETQLVELKQDEQREWEKEREEDIGAYIKNSLGSLHVTL